MIAWHSLTQLCFRLFAVTELTAQVHSSRLAAVRWREHIVTETLEHPRFQNPARQIGKRENDVRTAAVRLKHTGASRAIIRCNCAGPGQEGVPTGAAGERMAAIS